ncbi:hypothetical protein V8C42DRAFT_338088 [Trichoderma barbatum]
MDTEDSYSLPIRLQTNAENKSYYIYKDDDKPEQSISSVPFPPGKHRYSHTKAGGRGPFICPVRDCRVLSNNIHSLLGHFNGKHFRCLFNDNGDGTFSKVGEYTNEEGAAAPGIIVSQNPLPSEESPPAAPQYLEKQKKRHRKRKETLTPPPVQLATSVDHHAVLPLATRQYDGLASSKTELGQLPIQNTHNDNSTLRAPVLQALIAHELPLTGTGDITEMEGWEVAPGTVRDEETNTNVGFSSAYMSTLDPVVLSPGIAANILTLKPGHTYTWLSETNKVRMFFVAAGKIKVEIATDQAFDIGPNGLVVIRVHQSCRVVNWYYNDAILHCIVFDHSF